MSWLDNLVSPESRQVIGATTSKVITDIAQVANPVLARLSKTNLLPGGARQLPNNSGINPEFVNMGSGAPTSADWKVRIGLSDNNYILYNYNDPGIMMPLKNTRGVIFPYTPTVSVNHLANYSPQRFTHSNYTHMAYEGSEVQTIQVSGEFTAQNYKEADYVLACIYFLRSATKMFFGGSDDSGSSLAGNPPPLVYLNGYGRHYFPNVPCVITQFTHTMPSEVDYILTSGRVSDKREYKYDTNTGAGEFDGPVITRSPTAPTRIPTISTITVQLQPVYSKNTVAKFDLEQFAAGKLLDKGFI